MLPAISFSCHSIFMHFSIHNQSQNLITTKQGTIDSCEVKIADFGLSALVRLDEDGYDAEESGKRKRYTHLKEVRGEMVV